MSALVIQPSLPAFQQHARSGNLIPVYTELMADTSTPLSLYARLRRNRPAFLFESIQGGEHLSRYSFMGAGARKLYEVFEEKTRIHTGERIEERVTPSDPLELIEEELKGIEPVTLPDLPRFTGGAVGFIGYEYIHRVEPVIERAKMDELGMPLLYFMIADAVVAFDHARQRIQIIVNARLDGRGDSAEAVYEAAATEVQRIAAVLREPLELAPLPLVEPAPLPVPSSNRDRSTFEAMVEQTKEYIRAGDIIQGVLSQRFHQPFDRDPLDLYRALRVVNPSPYMVCLETPEFALVGASPEVHVRLTGDFVEIRPIAGTRPRGSTPEQDAALERDLLADEKERAEHLMLVDLARNDIGRVCKIGSISWPEYMVIERYSHVMHIVSQVVGRLAEGKTGFDLMRATFPAGTVSGAPKIRAMQIISELEGTARGPYSGAVGYFGFNGNTDSCIAIRTALHKDGTLHIQSGAGLVADSVPASEYDETVNKAKGMLKAVALALELDPV